MKLMLDTDICIDLIKHRPASLMERLVSHAVGDIGISVITLAELEYGVSRSSQPAKNREALDQFVSPLDVVPFDRRQRSFTADCGRRWRRRGSRSVRWTC